MTWHRLDGANSVQGQALLFSGVGEQLFATTDLGLWRSLDGGDTFSQAFEVGAMWGTVTAGAHGRLLHSGGYSSDDDGVSWTARPALEAERLFTTPAGTVIKLQAVAVGASLQRVSYSRDNGETFTASSEAVLTGPLFFHASLGLRLFALNETLRSDDDGRSWTRLAESIPHPVTSLHADGARVAARSLAEALSVRDSSHVWRWTTLRAVGEGGFLGDGRFLTIALDAARPISSLLVVVDPAGGSTALGPTSVRDIVVSGQTVLQSTAHGILRQHGERAAHVVLQADCEYHLSTEGRVHVAVAAQPSSSAACEPMLLSRDDGISWSAPMPGVAATAVVATSRALFVAGQQGLSRSLDDGETFSLVTSGFAVVPAVPFKHRRAQLVAAGDVLFAHRVDDPPGTLVASVDEGESWHDVAMPFPFEINDAAELDGAWVLATSAGLVRFDGE